MKTFFLRILESFTWKVPTQNLIQLFVSNEFLAAINGHRMALYLWYQLESFLVSNCPSIFISILPLALFLLSLL